MKAFTLFTNREFLEELKKILSRFDAQIEKVKQVMVKEKKKTQRQRREAEEKKAQEDPEKILKGLKSL